jgi:hypothetical protein
MISKLLVMNYFKTPKAVATYFGITEQAVSQWPDPIPEKRAYKLMLDKPQIFKRRARKAA